MRWPDAMPDAFRKMKDAIQRDRLYILLFVFIIVFNILINVASTPIDKAKAKESYNKARVALEKRDKASQTDDLIVSPGKLESILKKSPGVSAVLNLTGLLFIFIFVLGLSIDITFVSSRLQGRPLDIATHKCEPVKWSILDIARVTILFLFFAYTMIVIESFLALLVPAFKNENFRMIFNSSVLDILGAAFVIYFSVYKYKERLISLGLTLKNLGRNIFYGVVGYAGCVPVFLGTVFIVFVLMKLTGYTPEKQHVVELFLKEEDTAFLIYSSIFASILGPLIEELFFRGFMYNAVKKFTGVLGAAVITSSVFAALHTNIAGFLPIMALGLILTYVYEKTGSLVAPITLHVLHNLAMVYLVFLVKGLRAL